MSQYAKGRGENTVANRQHLDILEQGVVTWNHWRKEHPDIKPDLKEASLIGAALSEANLSNAKLRGANLLGADLLGADLLGADLSEAILRGADLFVADLSSANLFGTTLSGADLSSADLSGADLIEANLSNAKLRGAILSGADLSSCAGSLGHPFLEKKGFCERMSQGASTGMPLQGREKKESLREPCDQIEELFRDVRRK